MDKITLFGLITVLVSGALTLPRFIKSIYTDYKNRNQVIIKRKGSDTSITIPKNGTKEDGKRLLEYME